MWFLEQLNSHHQNVILLVEQSNVFDGKYGTENSLISPELLTFNMVFFGQVQCVGNGCRLELGRENMID